MTTAGGEGEAGAAAPARARRRTWFPKRPVEREAARAYGECRPEFRTGDLLCFRGRGIASFLIRAFTRSWYSHVGLVYWHQGRNFCIEAVGVGVRIVLVSELQRRYHGGIDYFRVRDSDEPQREKAVAFCFAQLGKLYDHVGIWRFIVAIVFGKVAAVRRDEQWFCSELVAAAYEDAGLPLTAKDESYTSPQDLAASPQVAYSFTVKPDA